MKYSKNYSKTLKHIMIYLKDFFTLGQLSVSYVMHKIFYLGTIFIAYKAYLFRKGIYLSRTYMKNVPNVQNSERWYTYAEFNNMPLAMLEFILFLIVVLVMWKFICELLIKFFSYFES